MQVKDQEALEKFREYEKTTKVFDFFTERGLDMYIFDPVNKRDDFEAFEALRIQIEKEGRPNNYLETEEELAKAHKSYYKALHERNTNTIEEEKQKYFFQ